MIVLSVRGTNKLGLLMSDISRSGSPPPTREREENDRHTTRRGEDHVGVFGGGGDSGDPALVAGHRAEVTEGFHGAGGLVCRRRRWYRARRYFGGLHSRNARARTDVTATVTGTV